MALYQVAELVPAGCWKEIPDDLSLPHRLGGQVGGPRQSPMRKERGRDFYYDVVDWVGGYPSQYAAAEEVQALLKKSGFECLRFRPPRVPTGSNEFVFKKRNR